MEITPQLQGLGLEDREIKIYLALLELAESTVLPIAKKAGIKRTYAYDILDSLIKKGLVSYIEKNGRRHYIAEDPKKIEHMLKEKLERFRDVLPEIRSIYNHAAGKPKVRFYEGAENFKQLYEEIAHTNEYASIASPDHFYNLLGKEYLDHLTDNIIKNKTKVRELFTYSYNDLHFAKRYQKGLQEVRLLPENFEIDTDILLFKDKLILFSFKDNIHAISIEGSAIIDAHWKLFNLLWNATKPGEADIKL